MTGFDDAWSARRSLVAHSEANWSLCTSSLCLVVYIPIGTRAAFFL